MKNPTELKTKLVFALGIDSEVFQKNHTGVYSFGNKGDLPWGHCKEDLKGFKAETENHLLIMGANTFRSLPKKLPGRIHVVMASSAVGLRSRNGDRPDMVIHGGSLSDAICLMKETYNQDVAVIGGKRLIEEALDNALPDEIIITYIYSHDYKKFEADVYIDMYDRSIELVAGPNYEVTSPGSMVDIENNELIDCIMTTRITKRK